MDLLMAMQKVKTLASPRPADHRTVGGSLHKKSASALGHALHLLGYTDIPYQVLPERNRTPHHDSGPSIYGEQKSGERQHTTYDCLGLGFGPDDISSDRQFVYANVVISQLVSRLE